MLNERSTYVSKDTQPKNRMSFTLLYIGMFYNSPSSEKL